MPSTNVLLLKEQIARLASVRPRTVDSWVQRGELRAIKVGRLNRFLLADFEKFLGVSPGTLKPPAD